MNVAFFLTPVRDVVCLPARSTMRQALERMEFHRYSAVPLVDDGGHYIGTLTEGDLLWTMKQNQLSFVDAEHVSLEDVPRRTAHKAVNVLTEIDSLLALAIDQNFVPVVDSREVLMGIVRRKAIIEYFVERYAREPR